MTEGGAEGWGNWSFCSFVNALTTLSLLFLRWVIETSCFRDHLSHLLQHVSRGRDKFALVGWGSEHPDTRITDEGIVRSECCAGIRRVPPSGCSCGFGRNRAIARWCALSTLKRHNSRCTGRHGTGDRTVYWGNGRLCSGFGERLHAVDKSFANGHRTTITYCSV